MVIGPEGQLAECRVIIIIIIIIIILCNRTLSTVKIKARVNYN